MRADALGTCSTYSKASGQSTCTACLSVHVLQSCQNCLVTGLQTDDHSLLLQSRADTIDQALCSSLSQQAAGVPLPITLVSHCLSPWCA